MSVKSFGWTGRSEWAETPLEMISALIDTVAARFGFYRHLPPEMIVFENYESARRAGFRGSRHPTQPHITAWWPGQGSRGLYGRSICRVTISYHMARYQTDEGRLDDILRCRQRAFGDRAMWIES